MTEELKPCPFCGASEATYYHPLNYSQGHMECEECGAFGPCCDMTEGIVDGVYLPGLSRTDAKSQAQERWNLRASPWVRVEDGLPRHMQRVFIVIKDEYSGEPLIHNVVYHCLICPIFETKYNRNYGPDDITHWMPIPPLPEQE